MEQFPNNMEKQAKWNEAISRVEKITDKTGRPVDTGIKETVAAFLVNGFDTIGSCEGHFDHGRPYPFIQIEHIKKTPEFQKKIEELGNEIKAKGYNVVDSIPTTETELHLKIEAIRKEMTVHQNEVEKKIKSLLEYFYAPSPHNSEYALTAWEGGSFFEVSAVSGAGTGKENRDRFERKEKAMSVEEKSKYLKNCQDEMKSFTEFLKKRFTKG